MVTIKVMKNFDLEIVSGEFSVYRFAPDEDISGLFSDKSFFSATRTEEELSVVWRGRPSFSFEAKQGEFSCIRIQGVLDFSLIGVLANISSVLAEENISVLAISTYNTDYFLIPKEGIVRAVDRLTLEGHVVHPSEA